jgi:hypothetical protein
LQLPVNPVPVYWSRQHGAYISLITAWVISGIQTGFTGLQLVALILLLSGLNFVELLSERFFRKSPLRASKVFWLYLYGLLAAIAGTILLFRSAIFPSIVFALLAGATAYLLLYRSRLHKHAVSEWIIFLLLAIAAFSGAGNAGVREIIPVAGVLALFFGSSIFTVKARFEKMEAWPAPVYSAIASTLILFYFSFNTFSIFITCLLLAKVLWGWFLPEKFHKTPIRVLGMIEGAFQVLLIAIFYFFY